MSNSGDKIKSVILRFILEYETYENWQKCVSFSYTNRISWLSQFVEHFDCDDIYRILKIQPQDSCHQINVRLIKLMQLMHSVEDLPEDDDFDSITPFEYILELTNQMLELRFKELIKVSLLKVKKTAQQESVIECVRQRKISLACSVFERVWGNVSPSLKSTKSQLSSMIKNEAENRNLPLSTFNDSFKQFLSKHFNNLATPFLTTFADKLIKSSPSTFGVVSKKKKLASEISSCKHIVVKCWLSNYFCYFAFTNVNELHLNKYSWILKFISENNLDLKSSLLIRFLFKYNEHLSSDQIPFHSPLDLSLSLIDEINKNYPEDTDIMIDLLNAMKYQIRKAAVLNWCLKNNFENARKVFEKLVCREGDEILSEDLEGYLKAEKSLDSYEQKDLHTSVQAYMTASFNPPIFLISTAHKILESIEKLAKEQDLEIKSVIEDVKIDEPVKEDVKIDETVKEDVKIDEPAEKLLEVSIENNHVNNEITDIKSVINGEDELTNTPNLNTPTSNPKMKKKVWLEEEEELIYKGTLIFGVGNWSTIARKLLLGRTNTDVKDKWRTMLKQGKVKKFQSGNMDLSATTFTIPQLHSQTTPIQEAINTGEPNKDTFNETNMEATVEYNVEKQTEAYESLLTTT